MEAATEKELEFSVTDLKFSNRNQEVAMKKAQTISMLLFPALLVIPGLLLAPSVRAGAPLVEESMVGLPVYPGLRMVSSSPGGDMGTGVTALPAVVGHTDDPMEQVVDFYAENLPGWNQGESFGSQVFWSGEPDEGFNLLDPESLARPSVAVMPPIREGAPVRVQYIYRN